jgi:hypothetical protein
MLEVLEGWARESQERRGVLSGRIAVLTPQVFDDSGSPDTILLVRADLVRSTITRVISNIQEVERLPGAELVRGGKSQVTFVEIRARLEDLMQAKLNPLIGLAGNGFGADAILWVQQSLQSAQLKQRAADRQAEALRQALRDYSGFTQGTAARPSTAPSTSSDVQAITPQLDRTFIEGIVEMSAANATFRQEITRRVIEASMQAANRAQDVEHYESLLESVSRRGALSLPMADVSQRLDAVRAEAKAVTQLFNETYSEYSRVAFRAGSAMYRIEDPVRTIVLRSFSIRSFALLLVGVFLATPVVLSVICLILFHLRRFVRSALPAQA